VRRRRFNHLFMELSVAVGRPVPRFDLWLALQERGSDPELLSRCDAIAFCDDQLQQWLQLRGLHLEKRKWRRLRRALERFDARHPTPEERFMALTH